MNRRSGWARLLRAGANAALAAWLPMTATAGHAQQQNLTVNWMDNGDLQASATASTPFPQNRNPTCTFSPKVGSAGDVDCRFSKQRQTVTLSILSKEAGVLERGGYFSADFNDPAHSQGEQLKFIWEVPVRPSPANFVRSADGSLTSTLPAGADISHLASSTADCTFGGVHQACSYHLEGQTLRVSHDDGQQSFPVEETTLIACINDSGNTATPIACFKGSVPAQSQGWLERVFSDPVSWAVSGGSLLLLVLGFVGWKYFFGRKAAHQPPSYRERDWAPAIAAAVVPQTAIADLQPLKKELKGLQQHVNEEVDRLKSAFSDLQASHADLSRKQSGCAKADDVHRLNVRLLASEAAQSGQIDLLTKSLQDVSKQEQDLHAGTPVSSTSQGTAAAVAAVVNEWIARNSHNRADLLTLAREAGLPQAKLASFDTQHQEQGAVVTVSYAFRDDENGPWLWVPGPGSDSIYAAPADAAAFRMGTAPGLLADLFEGLDEVQQGFAFETIYRPCRLQKSREGSSLYAKKERGLLRLRGTARPRSDDPPSFAAIRQPRQGSRPAVSDNLHWGAELAVWVSKVSIKLDEQTNDIERLQEQATRPVPARAAAGSDQEGRPDLQMDELRSRVAALQSEQQRAAEQWRQVTKQLQALESGPMQAPLPPVAQHWLGPAPADRVFDALRLTPPPLSAAAPILYPSPAQTSSPSTAQQAPTAPLLPAPASPRQVEDPTFGAVPEPPARLTEDRLKTWQGAFVKAAALPESEPLIVAMPSAFLYVQRVRALREQLARADGDADFSVVHLKREESGSLLEVHPTETSLNRPDETVCTICKTGHTWQLAVCAGKTGDDAELLVLLPASTLGKSIYLPGYSVLIEEPPQLFSTAETFRPALLRLAEGGNRYHVVQKLNVRAIDAAESGRGPL